MAKKKDGACAVKIMADRSIPVRSISVFYYCKKRFYILLFQF